MTLFEKGNKLGGTSSDILHDEEFFFNGPHYFFPNTKWVKEITKNIKNSKMNLKTTFMIQKNLKNLISTDFIY